MKAAAERFKHIEALRVLVKNEQTELDFVNKHAKAGKTYGVYVKVKGEQFYNEKTNVKIELSAGIVQQYFINRIGDLHRQIIKLGGKP